MDNFIVVSVVLWCPLWLFGYIVAAFPPSVVTGVTLVLTAVVQLLCSVVYPSAVSVVTRCLLL